MIILTLKCQVLVWFLWFIRKPLPRWPDRRSGRWSSSSCWSHWVTEKRFRPSKPLAGNFSFVFDTLRRSGQHVRRTGSHDYRVVWWISSNPRSTARIIRGNFVSHHLPVCSADHNLRKSEKMQKLAKEKQNKNHLSVVWLMLRAELTWWICWMSTDPESPSCSWSLWRLWASVGVTVLKDSPTTCSPCSDSGRALSGDGPGRSSVLFSSSWVSMEHNWRKQRRL